MHDHFGVVAIANDNLKSACVGMAGLPLITFSVFCECHGVYTTKKTAGNDASSAGATTTAGCRYIGSFETEKPKVFCIEDIVLVPLISLNL